jgi:hypothetical protein
MLVKMTDDLIATLGATDPKDCAVKISALIKDHETLTKSMSEQTTNFEARIKAIEDGLLTLQTSLPGNISGAVTSGMTAWATSDAGKRLIGAEASRITAEALAAVGTTPAKPTPAPTEEPKAKSFAELVQDNMAAGKSKMEAITAAMTAHPKAYAEYLKTGGQL